LEAHIGSVAKNCKSQRVETIGSLFLQTRQTDRQRASTYIILQVFLWEEEALDCEGDEVSALFWPVAIIILVKKKALERGEDCLYVVCMLFHQQILVKDADKRASCCYHGRNAPTMNGDGVVEN
jgi:hypothetical protein